MKIGPFWLRYGQKCEILNQGTPQKTGGAFIGGAAFIAEFTVIKFYLKKCSKQILLSFDISQD